MRHANPSSARGPVFRVDLLERRALLAFAPVGPEFRVNTFTAGYQYNPAVATDANGDLVVAWMSLGQDGSSGGVYAQRYNAAGAAQGAEFRVNTFTAGQQAEPAVACDADGDFVIAWASMEQEGRGFDYDVYAQRYDAAGVPQGGEFRVNTFTAGRQTSPSVACDVGGDFVVTWDSTGQDDPSGTDYGVYAQRYNAAGAPQGEEFRVNTTTDLNQHRSGVAMDADGDFVVAWQGEVRDGAIAGYGVYAQRFDAAGEPQGGEFGVNPVIAPVGLQLAPSVACDAAGGFAVAWQSFEQGGPTIGVYARRYDAAGAALGDALHVNTFTSQFGRQRLPSVACDPAGDFVVAWSSYLQDHSNWGVYARRYDAAGAPQGGEFRVNTFTAGHQLAPSGNAVACDAGGDFVVTWESDGQDGAGYGVYAQRYQLAPPPAAPRVTQVFADGTAWTSAFKNFLQAQGAGDAAFGYAIPVGPAQLAVLPWSGVDRLSVRFDKDVGVVNANLALRGQRVTSYPLSNFAYDPATHTATWTLGQPLRADKLLLDLDGDPGGVGLAGLALDGDWASGTSAFPSGDGSPGGDFRFRLNVLPGDTDRSGAVLANDSSDVKRKFFSSTTNPGAGPAAYSVFHDVTGSGAILADDFSEVKKRFFSTLPTTDPAAVTTATAAWSEPPLMAATLRRKLLG
jgi:hypothetical protein